MKQNSIKSGYGAQTVSDNIAQLIREGRERSQAIAIALHAGRKAYRVRYPLRRFPHWLRDMVRQNPAPRADAQAAAAARLFTRFTGQKGVVVERVRKPVIPDAVLVVGNIDAIDYTTVRDGKTERYRHRFSKNARPLFCVSHDGRQIFMLGGAYVFTARGIVDRKK